jgi:hypothetical protein
MKFEEWYNSYKITGLDKRTAEQVWDACKQECLNTIQKSYDELQFPPGVILRIANQIQKDV